jgi:hypothetical protein
MIGDLAFLSMPWMLLSPGTWVDVSILFGKPSLDFRTNYVEFEAQNC